MCGHLNFLFARFPSERTTALITLDAHSLCGCVRLYFAVKFRSAQTQESDVLGGTEPL